MVDRRLDIVYVRGIGFRGEEIMRSFQAHEALHHCQLYAKICVFVKHTKFYFFVKHANLFVISNDDFTQNFVSCRIVTLEYPSHCYNSNLLHFELQVLHCYKKPHLLRCNKKLHFHTSMWPSEHEHVNMEEYEILLIMSKKYFTNIFCHINIIFSNMEKSSITWHMYIQLSICDWTTIFKPCDRC